MTGPNPEPYVSPLAAALAANENNQQITPSDLGNMKMFLRRYGDIVRYSPERDTWYVWCGTHWEPDVLGHVYDLTEQTIMDLREHALGLPDEGNNSPREAMLRHAAKTENESSRRRILSGSRSHPRVAIRADDMDIPNDTVTCPNGTVDLKTGDIKTASPSYFGTACTAVAYEPEATSDLLDEWCDTFMPDPDAQRVMFAVLGRALRSGNIHRNLPLFLGPSTSGKSQFIGTVARVLAGYAVTINASVFRGNLDDKPRPDLVRAVRSRLAIAHEAAQTWDMHGDHVKRLTGQDAIPVRTLFKEIVEVQPTFTPIIVANEVPRVKGADQALRRRIVLVRFLKALDPTVEDPEKRRIFMNDELTRKAILARIVAGARDDVDVRGSSMESLEALAEAFDDVDHIGQFLAWVQEQGHLEKAVEAVPTSHCVRASDLHSWYVFWVRKHGDRADRDSQMNMRAFGQSLRARGWEPTRAMGTRWVGWVLKNEPTWL